LKVLIGSGFQPMGQEAWYSHPYNTSKPGACRHLPVEWILNILITIVEAPSTPIDMARAL
jgi:hypothetical protein